MSITLSLNLWLEYTTLLFSDFIFINFHQISLTYYFLIYRMFYQKNYIMDKYQLGCSITFKLFSAEQIVSAAAANILIHV